MKTLLLVDDSVFDREGLARRVDWGSLDIELVGTAENGEEGASLARALHPDIVLTDIVMPRMDGLEMAERIRMDQPDVRLVFMSSYDEFEYARTAVDLGADSYIMKPVVPEELALVLRRTCDAIESRARARRHQDELREKLRQSMPVLRENFLRELAYGRVVVEHTLASQASYLGIPLEKPFVAILAQPDSGPSMDPGEAAAPGSAAAAGLEETGLAESRQVDVRLLQEALAVEFASPVNDFTVVLGGTSLLLVHFCETGSDPKAERERTIEACERAREAFAKAIPRTATIGIGRFESPGTSLRRAYRDAERAVGSRFFSNGNRLVLSEEVPSEPERATFSPDEIGDGIGAILDGVQLDPHAFLLDFLPEGRLLEESFVRSFGFVFLVSLHQQLESRGIHLRDVVPDERRLWERMIRSETLPNIRSWLTNLLEIARRKAGERSSSRTAAIVRDIRKILDTEYAGIQEIAQVTDRLYISVRYANSIFRKETGITIGDYLFQQRMRAAKRLLADPYCRIGEVSEQVGYGSPSYFTSVFREHTGMTPREYRETHCGQASG